jgi:signal transduction histidine kinase
MRVRPVIFVWCLLFGATLLMAAAAWWLLGREADRIESLATGTLANRTATVADSIDLLMEEVRGGVIDGLLVVREVPEPRIALAEMVEGNPYVSVGYYFRGTDAVTVWLGERGELPAPGSVRGKAESGAAVYPWTLPEFELDRATADVPASATPQQLAESKAPSDSYAYSLEPAEPVAAGEDAYVAVAAAGQTQQTVITQNLALKEQRAAVRKVNVDNRVGFSSFYRSTESSDEAAEAADMVMPAAADLAPVTTQDQGKMHAEQTKQSFVETPLRKGWVHFVLEGKSRWMAWVGLPDGVDYIGAWLDRDAVLAELSKAISLSQQDGLHFRLIDAEGRTIAGDYAPRYNGNGAATPELSLAVGSALPQWRIETFRANGANTFGSSFRFVGGLFIGGLSLAILIGSAVLIWQAQRDARDAQLKTTFVANVSHELKTPLTSIRLFADMLYDGRVKDSTKQREYLQRMVNETQRLTRLVNNVLDFSRLERGQRRAKSESLELGAAVGAMVEAQRERLLAEGLAIDYHAPTSPLNAAVDRDALEQILLNLLDNAAKYAASGERAEVVLDRGRTSWSLCVNDFGPGIPAAERKQVFAAFHRSDDRLTSERPGCGLGLSIAARLAKEIGGELTLKENPPHGCSFVLKVPNV